MRQVDLSFEDGDVVSVTELERTHRHYRLDKMLRCIYIPRITVKWNRNDNNAMATEKLAESWNGGGRADFYMIFLWLKNVVKVSKVVQLTADDMADDTQKSHPDQVIINCLKDLKIEIWKWQRIDISPHVIEEAAGGSVKEACNPFVVFCFIKMPCAKSFYTECIPGPTESETGSTPYLHSFPHRSTFTVVAATLYCEAGPKIVGS